MKASVAIPGGLPVWILTRGLFTMLIHGGFYLTTLARIVKAFGACDVTTVVFGFMNMPVCLLAFVSTAVFYRIVLLG
jgi:uncharacterized membrane protein YvlD (DUF360 family)